MRSSAPLAPAARWPAPACSSRSADPDIKIVLADPMGAALYNWYAHGELKAEGSSISEGIGQGRITANLEGAPVDEAFQITDEEALPYIFDLVVEEGLVLGSSSAINIAGAVRMAERAGPGPHHRDHPVRLRHALSEQAVQPGIPAREGPAGAVLARPGPSLPLTREATHARSPGQHGMAGQRISRRPTSGWWTQLGSCRAPSATRRAEYAAAHIPGAVFFDMDEVGEAKGLHPHMVPAAGQVQLAGAQARPGRRQSGSWSTTTTASSPRRGCGGCSG